MDIKEEGRKLREAGKTATAVVTSAALLLGGVFHTAGELPEQEEDASPASIVEMISPDTDMGDDGDEEEIEEEDKKRGTARARWLARLPAGLRSLAALPVWAVGCGVLGLLLSVLTGGLSPILRTLVVWLGLAAVLTAAFCAAWKGVFPDVPLKKILKGKNFRLLLFGAMTLGVLEGVLLWRFPGKGSLAEWLRLLGSMALLGGVTASSLRREKRRREKEEEEKEKSIPKETAEERDRRTVMELADSVSRRY